MTTETRTDPLDAAKNAAKALSDLNTFAIVVSILEGGHIHTPSHAAARRIIKICLAERQKRLREYDRALKRVQLVKESTT